MLLISLAHAEDASFKSWQATCDNVRECSAYVLSNDEMFTGYLMVHRGSTPTAEPEVSVGLWSDGVGPLELTTVGGALPATLTLPVGDPDYLVGQATGAPARVFIEALVNARSVQVRLGGQEVGSFDLAGSSATFRWLDAQQRRAGTVTALVAKGPAQPVVLPPAPVVVRGPEVSQDGRPTALPKDILASAAYEECVTDWSDFAMETTVDRLAPGVLLWGVSCTRGAYNFGYRYWLSAEDGQKVRPAGIPGTDGDVLVNPSYDPKTRTLTAFAKGRGLGDCGSLNEWVWDGKAFVATEAWVMGTCSGVPVEAWPRTWHADVR